MLAALIRPLFNADSAEQARQLVSDALERLRQPLPKIAILLEEAEEDLLAFYCFPPDHWPKLRCSPRPEQPTILPTSYTTSWDLTVVRKAILEPDNNVIYAAYTLIREKLHINDPGRTR